MGGRGEVRKGGPEVKEEKIDMVQHARRICTRMGGVTDAEHAALRKIDVTPYVMPSLDEMAERRDRVSNATILRTLRHNLEQWIAGARGRIGKSDDNENDLYWVGRAHGFEKALELVASLERSLLK